METLINKELNTPQELKESLAEIKKYKLVLPCCGEKNHLPLLEGKEIVSTPRNGLNEVSPFCISKNGKTYFEVVKNEDCKADEMLKASDLYAPDMYSILAERHGDNLYLLSAGWGIVRANRKLPAYDITFKTDENVQEERRRPINIGASERNFRFGEDKSEQWLKNTNSQFNDLLDFLAKDKTTPIILMAGKNYLYRFWHLMKNIKNPVHVFYKFNINQNENFFGQIENKWNLYKIENGISRARTNWYYKIGIEYL